MEYFRINYKKLSALKQINFGKLILLIIIVLVILLFSCFLITIDKTETFYGIYSDGIIKFKIDIELSDIIKNNKNIVFNDKNVTYEFAGFDDYEIIDNKIYQIVNLKVDNIFFQNEIGKIKFYYGKEKLIAYILDLFK